MNAIAPGFFLTNQNRFLMTDKETGDWTPRGKTIIGHTPNGRGANQRTLFGCVWLLSPASESNRRSDPCRWLLFRIQRRVAIELDYHYACPRMCTLRFQRRHECGIRQDPV